jgi:hypothetical protein
MHFHFVPLGRLLSEPSCHALRKFKLSHVDRPRVGLGQKPHQPPDMGVMLPRMIPDPAVKSPSFATFPAGAPDIMEQTKVIPTRPHPNSWSNICMNKKKIKWPFYAKFWADVLHSTINDTKNISKLCTHTHIHTRACAHKFMHMHIYFSLTSPQEPSREDNHHYSWIRIPRLYPHHFWKKDGQVVYIQEKLSTFKPLKICKSNRFSLQK